MCRIIPTLSQFYALYACFNSCKICLLNRNPLPKHPLLADLDNQGTEMFAERCADDLHIIFSEHSVTAQRVGIMLRVRDRASIGIRV